MKRVLLCWILGVTGWAATATRIDLSSQPPQVGQPVLIRAAVYQAGSGQPVGQGNIAFTVDGVVIPKCEAQWVYMSSGAAECRTSFPNVATYRVVATYAGTSDYAPSTASLDLVVGKLYANAYLASYPLKAVYGGTLEVNALMMGVDSPKPGGTFTFLEGATEIVTRSVEPVNLGGRAAMALPLPVGTHTITGIYNGDDFYQISRPAAPVYVTVEKGPPGVYIAATPTQVAQPTTINVLVLPEGAGGTVTFTGAPGCGTVDVRGNYASCTTVFPTLGTVTVGAQYSGDKNLTAASVSMKLTVGRVVAGVYVAFTPPNPVYGQPVQVGALALGAPGVAPPTGVVTFSDPAGGSGAGQLGADGHAYWTTQPAAGVRVVTATYNGDANYGTSQGVGSLTVAKATTATTLSSTDGRTVTATVAVVAPGSGTPTGTVRFLRDNVVIGGASLVGTSATLDVTGRNGNLRGEYLGDLNFLGSASAVAAILPASVDLRLLSDRNPAPEGPVTFIAAAVPNPGATTPAGTVRITVDGAPAGSAALAQGSAAVTVELKAGTHAVAASYSGDTVYPPATASMTQVVTAPAGKIVLTANPQSPVYGEPITITAQLPAGSTGKVTFMDAGVPLGTTDGVLTVSRLDAGTHAVVASWQGDGVWAAATAQLALTVAKARTTIALTVSGGLAAARVLPIAPGAGTPSGSVRFADAATAAAFAGVALEGGTASAAVPAGVSLVTALYDGDSNFVASASASAGLLTVVNAASYNAAGFAPGEMVTVFGANLAGPAQLTDSAGVARGADLLFVAGEQASLVLPDGLAEGVATLKVAGLTAALPVGRTAPGLFTADASGHGAPAGQAVRVVGDKQETVAADVIDLDADAVYLILYATGVRSYRDRVVCTVGGRAVPVVFAGPQGGSPGIDQVNVLLPPELKGAGRVDVVVTADGVASNAVTVVLR